jgi:hypothetical protein
MSAGIPEMFAGGAIKIEPPSNEVEPICRHSTQNQLMNADSTTLRRNQKKFDPQKLKSCKTCV